MLTDLNIEPQQDSLKVLCSVEKGVVELEGSSYPEDAVEFFKPIYFWLKEYFKITDKLLNVNIKIDYINSSSIKCMYDMMEVIEEYHQNGRQTQINWFFKKDDYDMEETGEEFKKFLKIPFDIKSY